MSPSGRNQPNVRFGSKADISPGRRSSITCVLDHKTGGVRVEQRIKPLNWLSALDRAGEEWRPHFLPDGNIDEVARVRTNATVEEKTPGEVQRLKASIKMSIELTAQACQRAFDEARKNHPDALYEDLSEIAAKQLRISGRRLRKVVPNPFR